MTPAELIAIMPFAGSRAETYAAPLTSAMDEFGISTRQRQAAFLAHVAHESGSLLYTAEIASGTAYEGRKDLGNTEPGDGTRYKGHGLFQITGRANHLACGKALGLDLIANPELLETPAGASRSAGWFWQSRNLNNLADLDKFGSITKVINGDFNGIDDRIQHWLRARRALGIA